MKPKSYHHGDLKNALVEAGIAILEEAGVQGLSLRAIAARVGVSHTAPKNHFGSLRGLLTAIGTEAFRRHAAFMNQGLTGTSQPKDRLQAAMQGYTRFAEAHPGLFQIMFSPHYCDFEDPDLQTAASASYNVLAGVATDLDWDKSDLPGAQQRTEMMLWSLVHGYAALKQSHQFRPVSEGAETFDISEIAPDFDYKPAKT